MTDKELIFEMFNKMDDDFKHQHEFQIQNMLETYPCISLMKDDLIGYAENEYEASAEIIEKILTYIRGLDSNDMQNMADDFSNDCVMESFWIFVENQLDFIKEEIK